MKTNNFQIVVPFYNDEESFEAFIEILNKIEVDDNIFILLDNGSNTDEIKSIAQKKSGNNWKFVRDNPDKFTDGYLEEIMGPSLKSGGGKEGFYRRLHWDKPTPTLTCQPQQLATSLCHPEKNRPLSIPEYSAVQDFPHGYSFEGSKSSQYRQIGNAVPIRMSSSIGGLLLSIAEINDE